MPIRIEMQATFPKSTLFEKGGPEKVIALELRKFIRFALLKGQPIAASLTPVGATGNLKGRIVTQVAKGKRFTHEGSLKWNSPYASTVDKGGPPRLVPLEEIRQWTGAVLGDPDADLAVQGSISRIGTPSPRNPRPGVGMSDRFVDGWTPVVEALLQDAHDLIVQKLSV